jgi:hypothetical protein
VILYVDVAYILSGTALAAAIEAVPAVTDIPYLSFQVSTSGPR